MNEPTPAPANRRFDARRMARLLAPGLVVVVVYAAWEVVPTWVFLGWSLIPRGTRRALAVGFLEGLLGSYVLIFAAALLALPILGLMLARLRPGASRLRARGGWLARLLLLDLSILFSIAMLEIASAWWLAWLHRAPEPVTAAATLELEREREQSLNPTLPTRLARAGVAPSAPGARPPLKLLSIGESSGRGEPYHPWLSAAQIAAWKLESVLGRPVDVDMWATGGARLESMHQRLAKLDYLPDAILLFSGHNEFQSRWAWNRDAARYRDESPASSREVAVRHRLLRASPACRLILEEIDHQLLDATLPRDITRELVDHPLYSAEERAEVLADFRRRAEAIADFAERIHTLLVVFVPASNDGGYEPNRSVLPLETTKVERLAFEGDVRRARALEQTDPEGAGAIYRRLISSQPGFAETHFRLARLLERAGAWEEARTHYIRAREADAIPLRCPDDFRAVYRDLAARHPSLVLVDCEKVFAPISHHGILDDHLFHDAQHPNLAGYVALARDNLTQLRRRHAFGWPEATPVPPLDLEDCARHFGLDRDRWAIVCDRSSWFYRATAFVRYDPRERQEKEAAYKKAARLIRAGTRPDEAGIVGLGIPPAARL